jgi:hypothetical protein
MEIICKGLDKNVVNNCFDKNEYSKIVTCTHPYKKYTGKIFYLLRFETNPVFPPILQFFN